ncbi:hypothetical protein J1605_022051 [Eschrichtius robustus]|uniref:Uncharacterized protein n=1 Tax=Eschrichtius robustus TaxID=9764 RepID=A0AB34HDE2_ESCRO|nr:hypothetical protein J1605_022051 [Eschrichtius robustus]
MSVVLSAALNALHLKSEGGMDCPAWASSAAASREEPGALESGHCWSVLAGDRATLQEVPGLLQDPGHHVAREIGRGDLGRDQAWPQSWELQGGRGDLGRDTRPGLSPGSFRADVETWVETRPGLSPGSFRADVETWVETPGLASVLGASGRTWRPG